MTQGTNHFNAADDQYRVLVKSVGNALPSASAAVAKGLGLPTSTVVSRLYRAPAVLVDDVDEKIARQMVGLLADIGYEAEVQPVTEPLPLPEDLYDVALYIEDPGLYQSVVRTVAQFIGIPETDAVQMITTSPGVILGSVSLATVDALAGQVGSAASILSSRSDQALYSLFLTDDSGSIHRRIINDIKNAGLNPCSHSGLVVADVDHTTAQLLWQRHQASGLLRIVNQAFMRFDLVLQKPLHGYGAGSQQVEVLSTLAGVPEDMADEVLSAAPITLLEAVPNSEVEDFLTRFTAAGLSVRADLITFQMLTLEVSDYSNGAALLQILETYDLSPGQGVPRPPFQIPGVIPELQARVLRAELEQVGAQVSFVENMQ